MRKLSINLLALSLLSLLSIGAYGYDKDLKEHVTIPGDLIVGNATLKKGDYLVKFDAATNQVSFKDMNKNKVVATAMATVQVNDKKAESDVLYTRTTPIGEILTGLKLGGQHEELSFAEPLALTETLIITPVMTPTVEIEVNKVVEPCGDCDDVLPPCNDC